MKEKDEKWERVKKKFSGKQIVVTTEWGIVDFRPAEKEKLVGGEDVSYDEFLDLQKESACSRREYFESAYYNAVDVLFQGEIGKVDAEKSRICFKTVVVTGTNTDGRSFFGKEEVVWMSLAGFEQYQIGDHVTFGAKIFRFVEKEGEKKIDFGLRKPTSIRKNEDFEIPSNMQMQLQEADAIICENCPYNFECNNQLCVYSDDEIDELRKIILGQRHFS